jgi:filamentous hemagglutinin family protein
LAPLGAAALATSLAGACALAFASLSLPARAQAQDGAGSTGATVLQLLAGGRASALSGAYTAATGDADVLFYNPAGIASVRAAAGLSYQRHVEDIGVATASGVLRFGRIVLGASAIFLDYGDVAELTPDPAFGGQTGLPTGRNVSASELAGRLAAAVPLMGGRLRVGAAVGLVSVDLAGVSRSTPMFDAGAQYSLPLLTVGASIRNAGGSLSGEDLAEVDLPTEARIGAMLSFTGASGIGAAVSADVVSELNEGGTGVVAGIEAGLIPSASTRIGAVGRVGYNATSGDDGLGSLQLGAGLSMGSFALDYAYQSYDFFGSLHRFGVRWSRLP